MEKLYDLVEELVPDNNTQQIIKNLLDRAQLEGERMGLAQWKDSLDRLTKQLIRGEYD